MARSRTKFAVQVAFNSDYTKIYNQAQEREREPGGYFWPVKTVRLKNIPAVAAIRLVKYWCSSLKRAFTKFLASTSFQ